MANELKGNAPLVQVEHLKKYFQVGRGKVLHAVDDVTFSIPKGTTLGLVGESGCGKTTVGRTLVGLYQPDGGRVTFDGQDITPPKGEGKAGRSPRRMQMVYQDPYASLNPFFTVGEIITEGLEIHNIGENKKERMEIAYGLLNRVGLHREQRQPLPPRVLRRPAAAGRPGPFAGGKPRVHRLRRGDFGAGRLGPGPDRQHAGGFPAVDGADLPVYRPRPVDGPVHLRPDGGHVPGAAGGDRRHPRDLRPPGPPLYPGALTGGPVADPDYEKARAGKRVMLGEVASPINPGPGCRFCSRCPRATEVCKNETPQLKNVGGTHQVACHNL